MPSHYKTTKKKTSTKAKKKMTRKKATSCWKGYERVPGTKAGTPGSCRKKGSNKRKKK